ncbi:endonuclease/exonuclease/phosphatase family protein [Candidatus Uhrbacteria bacterium]|nr:endonuclease/exonuclease/phosphatase family protein [Candidatus Uhrbacteria bacterium]
MKLMTYNILNGGQQGIDAIIEVVRREAPDYLTLNEANTFAADDNRLLKEFAGRAGFPFFDIALSGEHDYHVAVFSTYPLRETHKLTPLMRACLIARIDTECGPISIASLHLTPFTEDMRDEEIDRIIKFQKSCPNRILMGDMNSLSRYDGYDPGMVEHFNDMQLKKFTTNGNLRFDAIDKIMSVGYHDTAVELGKNNEYTAPTAINEFAAHSNMRLDYIFLSESLTPYLKDYRVIKNELTENASDHYPVVAELS